MEKLFGCCSNTGDFLDEYMERHWAENDLERAIELRREQESVLYSQNMEKKNDGNKFTG